MNLLQCCFLLLFTAALTACNRSHYSLPKHPEIPVTSLYTQVLARHPVGISGNADMQAFGPYLSQALRQKIDNCTIKVARNTTEHFGACSVFACSHQLPLTTVFLS